jgi:LEA14-like dessication related protein
MNMKRGIALAAAAVAFAATAACSTLGRQAFADPVVTLKDVQVASLGLMGGNLNVKLNVYNPNGYRLDATRLTYRLLVDTTPLANGIVDSRFTVQDNDSTTVTIPVTFTYAGLGAAGRSIMNTGAVNYHVLGDVTVGTAVGSFTVPYSSVGRFTTTGIGN